MAGIFAGQTVTALIFRVSIMAAYPLEMHDVAVKFGKELFPEIAVFDWGFGRCPPAVLLPPAKPVFGNGIADVLGIADQSDIGRSRQRLETGHNRKDFHPVIGGVSKSSLKGLLMIGVTNDCGPAAGSWIAKAGAISENEYFFHFYFP